MKQIITVAVAILALMFSVNVFASENCTMSGEFTQGQITTPFSWFVQIDHHSHGFRVHGTSEDNYGEASIDGRCEEATYVCSFIKQYYSGQSNGATFYYSGNLADNVIQGGWGFQEGDYNGGRFFARISECN